MTQALKGGMYMPKLLPLLIVAGFLVDGTGSSKLVPEAINLEESGCYQGTWQVQSVPQVNKRSGSEVLEKYESPRLFKRVWMPVKRVRHLVGVGLPVMASGWFA